MERQILIPLDGSPLAEQVLPHAVCLARATDQGLHLLRVVPSATTLERLTWPRDSPLLSPAPLEAAVGPARDYLRAVAEQLATPGLPVSVEVRIGDPAEEILAAGPALGGITHIAMATHGRGGLGRWLFGSVAARVLPATPVPLLLVPARELTPPAVGVTYRTILVPLDGSACAERALQQAVPLARALNAELLLLSVTPSLAEIARAGLATLSLLAQYEAEDRRIACALAAQVKELRADGVRARYTLHQGVPAEEILAVSADEPVDLIVMGTHGRRGWDRFWLGSVAWQVVAGTCQPVLLVRSAEAHARESAPPGGPDDLLPVRRTGRHGEPE